MRRYIGSGKLVVQIPQPASNKQQTQNPKRNFLVTPLEEDE
jgi:hypothetical protein